MEALFAYEFQNVDDNPNIQPIIDVIDMLDKKIVAIAPEWPIDKIAKIDLTILRLAVYELTIEKKAPAKVIIDEAVELAKAYGGEGSAKFVNGALGAIIKNPN
jgi:N utilization substance protein B